MGDQSDHLGTDVEPFDRVNLEPIEDLQRRRDADLLVVGRALEHRVVEQKLLDYGVTPDEVQARLATMSDEDLHTLATASAGLPSGGDGLGALVTILIIVLLVTVILKLMNKEIVVK